MARRPYDLRHAALSTWLNAGAPPAQIARCIGGRRQGPPEDRGGIWAFNELHTGLDDTFDAEEVTEYLAPGPGVSGRGAAPVALLLPGGGGAATAWSALAAGLSPGHRVVAVDPVGQPGLSARADRPVTTFGDLTDWLDQVVALRGVSRVALIGHSYGARMALRYAVHAPRRSTVWYCWTRPAASRR